MNAKELYDSSYKAYISGLSQGKRLYLGIRIVNALRRSGFDATNDAASVEQIREAVRSGDIWKIRNIGEKSIMEICEWLVDKEV